MNVPRAIRDRALIDAIESTASVEFTGTVWRAVRDGRDVLQCSDAGGRWDDGTFDVLYTSQNADGAMAEMYYHLSRGQPVFPSQVIYRLFELRVAIKRALHLADVATIARLGVDTSRYGILSYADRYNEYPRTQEIAETALFLGFDGLVVPNARWNCANVVIFCDRLSSDEIKIVQDCGLINWDDWKQKQS